MPFRMTEYMLKMYQGPVKNKQTNHKNGQTRLYKLRKNHASLAKWDTTAYSDVDFKKPYKHAHLYSAVMDLVYLILKTAP